MDAHIDRLKVLVAGIISLILMLGVARFAYTPLMPLMQYQAGLGISDGGWLASINYMGYLTGAITAASVSQMVIKDRLYRIGLVLAVLSTIGMALSSNIIVWAVMRYLAGLSSAAGLLVGSGLVLNWLIRHGYRSELGLHFSGVGIGIAVVSGAAWLMVDSLDWQQQWLGLGMVSVMLAIPAWLWMPKPDADSHQMRTGEPLKDAPPSPVFLRLMMAAYCCAGVGYVISATFIVAIVNDQSQSANAGNLVFLVLGLGAAPACYLWDRVARRIGDVPALLAAFLVHAVSILLPAFSHSLISAYISAVLFGATFMGIVSLVLTMAGRFYPTKPAKMMGKMTISYGCAQIIAPTITGYIAEWTGSYSDGLFMAGGFMLLGSVLVYQLRGRV